VLVSGATHVGLKCRTGRLKTIGPLSVLSLHAVKAMAMVPDKTSAVLMSFVKGIDDAY
jgi:hypothetical protein